MNRTLPHRLRALAAAAMLLTTSAAGAADSLRVFRRPSAGDACVASIAGDGAVMVRAGTAGGLFRLAPGGDLTWQDRLGGVDVASRLLGADDGSAWLVGQTGTGFGVPKRLVAAHLDPTGAVSWAQTFPCRTQADGAVGALTASGTLLLAGTVHEDGLPSTCMLSSSDDVWLLEIDASGAILRQSLLDLDSAFPNDLVNSVRAAADGGVVISGSVSAPGPVPSRRSFVLKLLPDWSLDWLVELTATTSAVQLTHAEPLADGSVLVVGSMGFTAISGVAIRLRAGTLAWGVSLSSPTGAVGLSDAVEALDLSLVAVGLTRFPPGGALAVHLGSDGRVLAEKLVDPTVATTASRVARRPDGTLVVSGSRANPADPTDTDCLLVELAPDLTFAGSCPTLLDESLVVAPLAPVLVAATPRSGATAVVGEALALTNDPELFAEGLLCSGLSCASDAREIHDLVAVKAGANVGLTWAADAAAPSYNLWTVADRRDLPLARLSGRPTAVGVTGCAEPSPAPFSACVDAGAVGGRSDRYYQVRASCDAVTEGP